MLTGRQIFKARRLLSKTTPWLSRQSGVEYSRLIMAQRSEGNTLLDSPSLSVLRRTLEAAGVEFYVGQDDKPDVRLAQRPSEPEAAIA